MSNRHVIQRLKLEIDFPDQDTAFRGRNSLAGYWENWLISAFDKACDAVCPTNQDIMIPRLELDLGEIEIDDFDDQFLQRTEHAINKLLHVQRVAVVEDRQVKSNADTAADTFLFYLGKGFLPWWVDETALPAWTDCLKYILSSTSETQVLAFCKLLENVDVILRIFSMIKADDLNKILEDTTALSSARSQLSQELNQRLKRYSPACMPLILALLRIRNFMNQVIGGSVGSIDFEEFVARECRFFRTLEQTGVADIRQLIWYKQPVEVVSQQKVEMSVDEHNNRFGITQAGVILVAPFLPQLFKTLGYLDASGKDFKDRMTMERAVRLIGYVAYGEVDVPEYRLVLAKAICGFDVEHAMDLSVPVSPEELSQADGLLHAVLEYWTVVKSVDALRESFFKRDGILYQEAGRWLLRVERRSIDVLLDYKGPSWNFRLLLFPWQKKLIETEW